MSVNKKTHVMGKEGLNALRNFQRVSATLTKTHQSTQPFMVRCLLNQINGDSLKEDGVDHINISRSSASALGRIFSLADQSPYFDTILNMEIPSVETFFFFISDKERKIDNLKQLPPPNARRGKDDPWCDLKNLPLLMAWATYSKIKSYADICQILSSVEVPFDCYQMKGHIKERKSMTSAIALMVNKMADAIYAGVEPDVRVFLRREQVQHLSDSPEDLDEAFQIFTEEVRKALEVEVESLPNDENIGSFITRMEEARKAAKEAALKKQQHARERRIRAEAKEAQSTEAEVAPTTAEPSEPSQTPANAESV